MDIRKLKTVTLFSTMFVSSIFCLFYLTLIIYLFRLGTVLGTLSGIVILGELLTGSLETVQHAGREIALRNTKKQMITADKKTVKDNNVIKMGFDLSGNN